MSERRDARRMGTRAAAIVVAIVAAVACGAAQGGADEGKKKGGKPLAPTVYDPRVSLAPLVEKVSPAVVNIKTSMKVQIPSFGGPEGLFEFFFGPRGQRRDPIAPRERTQQAAGSGFIIDPSGLVVTNHHVVARADEIEVQLSDEKTFKAVLVGSDERTDVALLRLEGAKGLPTVRFGDSEKLRVGDHVVAIGNPFGLDHTVTSGIVSAKERVIGAGPYDDFIQTDASINPGNSGGPMFNLDGEVVGINTAIVPHGQGIGFAIPASLARQVIDSLRSDGKVVRGWLGIMPQPLDENLARAFGLKHQRGALVANVEPGSPAMAAGMKTGDVILEVGGEALRSSRDIYSAVAALKPGAKVPFKIIRGGKTQTLKVTIGSRPAEDGEPREKAGPAQGGEGRGKLGFSVAPLDERARRQLEAKDVEGVVVVGVEPGRKTAEALEKGDVIVEVNREPVPDVAAFEKATKDLREGDDLLLLVFRKGAWTYQIIRL